LDVDIFEKSSRGCYEVVNKEVLRQYLNFTDKKELLSYVKILKEILPSYYEKLDSDLKKEIEISSQKSKELYHFLNNPLEDFSNNHLLKEIEQSITNKRKVNFAYKSMNYTDAKPLQIVFMEGNLYLAILTNEEINGGFKFLRINYIQEYKVLSTEYNETSTISKAYEFLKEFQTPFAWFDSDYKQVKISATVYAKEFFKLKKHLPSQEYQEFDDGTAQLTYYVTNYMEIALLVKKWFPHLKIIEPVEWSDRLNEEIKSYLGVI
jgi:predicted DNA-binding transcriptional regulator YafY